MEERICVMEGCKNPVPNWVLGVPICSECWELLR